jgi:RNA polymerase sigma-70 factor (ECF subfamily)
MFTTTRWSLVSALDRRSESTAQVSLTELCLRYWYPVYAHARRRGHAENEARDLTRAFFGQLTAAGVNAGALPPQGNFRSWLLDRLNAFLAVDDGRSMGESTALEFPDAGAEFEARLQTEAGVSGAPDVAFQRSFALEVLALGSKRLRKEATDARRIDMYAALEPYLGVDPPPGRYEELARTLGMPPLAVAIALKRLRGRFRELVDAELADTVTSSDDFRAERDALQAALAGTG